VLTQHFTNMQSSVYWSGTEYSPGPVGAWDFYTDDGYQDLASRTTSSTVGPCAPDKSPPPRYPRRAC